MIQTSELFKDFTQIDFVGILVIAVVAWGLNRFVHWFFPWLAERAPSRFRLYLLPAVPVLKLAIIATAILSIMPLIIDPTPERLLVAISAAAIALGFAFQEYASSLIAGLVTVFERPYRVGDWVQIEDAYGEVISVGFRAVQLRTPDDSTVLIPHKKLWDATIYNDNKGNREHLCVADFYLHPEHNADEVRQKLRKVALTSPYLHISRPISVIVREKPWGTHYRLKAYPIDGREQFNFITDLTVRGKAALAGLDVSHVVAPIAAP
ncbi:MAG TPA: mechanosensitive ion channel domain-containing protein [Anaerolineae bacterium]|jgi:small-conductance mechanosensitive channel|nr:mechanosensitive ion channel domain-containing protein [Anaerolineae bacterium]